jgi:tetratricopeptide (TPR) repeat protein
MAVISVARLFRSSAVTLLLLCYLPSARSASLLWNFVPTEFEWQAWPVYCRVQWTHWNNGLDLHDNPIYSDSIRSDLRAAIGDRTFDALHHWCASIHYLTRARATLDGKTRTFLLNQALGEADFSYVRSDPQSPVYPNMSVTIAQIRLELGAPDQAVLVLKRAIAVQPKRPEAYEELSMIYRKHHQLDLARDVLHEADSALNGESAEIKYDLGLIEFERGDMDAAVGYAKAAYGKGYPLEGLKLKLEKRGRWPS